MTIGFYMRLSLSDSDVSKGNKDESYSIENQRLLLTSFVEDRDDLYGEIREYIDDGYTGTNFDRPAFIRMIEDAKKGLLQVIIVKDLSRLGRDYIDVGDYLEQIFPLLGIRFIAVCSMYDSNDYQGKTMGLEMNLSNLVNSLYSKDLSKKYKSAIQTKWKQGKSTSGRVPYGYVKSKSDKYVWEVDPEAAEAVRLIFDKAERGWGTREIAEFLNENRYLTPGQYKEKHGVVKYANRVVTDEEWLWDTYAVLRILKCYSYTGALVQGLHTSVRVGSRASRTTQPEERFIVESVHPPIVSEEQFYNAQSAIRSGRKHTLHQKTGFSLGGKIRCGTCGLSMSYHDAKSPTVACRHKQKVGQHSKCDSTVYSAVEIEAIVLYSLKRQFRIVKATEIDTTKPDCQSDYGISAMEQEIAALKTQTMRNYEAYAEGVISKEQYLQKKTAVNEHIRQLEDGLTQTKKLLEQELDANTQRERFIKNAEKSDSWKHLTKKLVDEYIDAVIIYDPQHIEVKFSFEDTLMNNNET